MKMSLEGKVALVTGGSRGIGAEIVRAFAEKGAQVAFTYSNPDSKNKADKLIEEVTSKTGSKAVGVLSDIRDTERAPEVVKQVLELFEVDAVDILVNNAGIGGLTALEDATDEAYLTIFDTNVKGVIFLTQATLPYFPRNGGGRIINVSSVAARKPYPGASIYSASKAALEALTRTWAVELGRKYGLTVNAINPGPVDTGVKGLSDRSKPAQEAVAARHGEVRDIADIVLFLAEERSRWVSGDVISANGGLVFV